MASSLKSAGTGANDTSVGTVEWGTPGSITSSDNTNASASNATGSTVTSNYLKATNFGFTIPTNATIDGVLVEIEQDKNADGDVLENSIRLVKGGTITGDNKSTGASFPSAGLGTYVSYGGASDLWGITLTDADVNSSDFGVVIVADLTAPNTVSNIAVIDHIRMTVYYTEYVPGTMTGVSSMTGVASLII